MESLEQKLRQLDQDREEADQRYNEALTALDRALPRPPDWPNPAPVLDDSQLPSINSSWDIAATSPALPGGWRGRLAGLIWRTVAPYLQQQASFNSRIVDHLNRNAAARARPICAARRPRRSFVSSSRSSPSSTRG